MILGIWQDDKSGDQLREDLSAAMTAAWSGGVPRTAALWADDGLAFGWTPLGLETMDELPQPVMNPDQTVVLLFQGKIYNLVELGKYLGFQRHFQMSSSGEALVHLYAKRSENFLERVNGKFAFALWDRRSHTLLLGRDRLGIEPFFYHQKGPRLVFSTSLRALLATGWVDKDLNYQAILQYLLFCYNPGQETFVRGVQKLPAGCLLKADRAGMSVERYWRLSFAKTEAKSERCYGEEILDLIRDAVQVRAEPQNAPGIFLSGGTDSSTLVSLASRIYNQPLRTFSFRCRGKSFDESHYARLVAERYQANHTVVPYDAQRVLLISKAVECMDEPFCDIGIEIGTYLLGQAAGGQVSYVFSGEGGDEAFGGHPVYLADKVATLIDAIPRILLRPLTWSLQRFPDSDQKKNLQVKAKRFAFSISFPRELLSHRWRAYYTLVDLQRLCTEDFLHHCDTDEMFAGILRYNREADGQDQLSRSLYSDYWTLVDFYLRRLQLLRAFSVESRLPLLDYRLVEYAAKMPSSTKVRGFTETKYIYKKVLNGVIPHEILYGRPKLGHSVPLKNWLREDDQVRQFLMDHISQGHFRDRGFFRDQAIGRMVDEHTRRIDNHSHRLWGLLVLELWLRAHIDG